MGWDVRHCRYERTKCRTSSGMDEKAKAKARIPAASMTWTQRPPQYHQPALERIRRGVRVGVLGTHRSAGSLPACPSCAAGLL
jgi:hypothetical protein